MLAVQRGKFTFAFVKALSELGDVASDACF
jgi:hypothetical protein